jgi:hypothetical protein
MGTRKKYGSLICRVCLGNHLQKTNNFHLTKLPHTHPPQKPIKKCQCTLLPEQANQNPKYQFGGEKNETKERN